MKVLLTGAAGFIGCQVGLNLLAQGNEVVGVDNLNDYYDVSLKRSRLSRLAGHKGFSFVKCGVEHPTELNLIFSRHNPQRVIHLAAQAGVRYSVTHPHLYAQSNLTGFFNVLECCRQHRCEHLVYASSSSVYGSNRKVPFSVGDPVDHPVSLYAATKKSNELMAHSYSHLFGLPTTGLRFFTVYGPWGRPDMAPFLFLRSILAGTPIQVFNYGKMRRDFTYIDDVADGVVRVLNCVPTGAPSQNAGLSSSTSFAPYRIYNIGNSEPVELLEFISLLEEFSGKPAVKELLPMQPGDVEQTFADVADLVRETGFRPSTTLKTGLKLFFDWYQSYYTRGEKHP